MVNLDYEVVGHTCDREGNTWYVCDLLVNGEYLEEFNFMEKGTVIKEYDEVIIPLSILQDEYAEIKSDKNISAKQLRKSNKIADKIIRDMIKSVNKDMIKANEKGRTRTCFNYGYKNSDYVDEVKQHFMKLGYTFQPTGYVGGVWQETEDICW